MSSNRPGPRTAPRSPWSGSDTASRPSTSHTGTDGAPDHGAVDEVPEWSPKGDAIAFHRQVGNDYDLFTVDAATGEQRRLTNDPKQQTNP